MADAMGQAAKLELQSVISASPSLSFVLHLSNKKSFQFLHYCLIVVLVFEVIVYFDGNFTTNDDPPFHVSRSWLVLTCHCIETSWIRHFEEIVCSSTIYKSNLLDRSPPLSFEKFILKPDKVKQEI